METDSDTSKGNGKPLTDVGGNRLKPMIHFYKVMSVSIFHMKFFSV